MPSRLLYQGCQPGHDVMDLQDGLNVVTTLPAQASAHALLAVDGVFGAKTATRVREFQKGQGLAVDGVVGQLTWGALVVLLQSVPGLQIGRPLGGSGSGPAKGLDGESVYGKVEPKGGGKGSSDPYGQGGGKDPSQAGGKMGGHQQAGAGGTSYGKAASGGGSGGKEGGKGSGQGGAHDDQSGSKQGSGGGGKGGWMPWMGNSNQAWAPPFTGSAKASGGKGGGSGSDAGGKASGGKGG